MTEFEYKTLSIDSIIESPVFYSHLSAYENMELHCRYMGAGNECCASENIMETLSMLGIAETGNKAVGKFSLGMKQRLALARAMLTKPDLLILDEPINGLDPQGIIEVRELLLRINHEYHTSILISSHILDELSKIADTIGIIDHGAILAEVSMKELTAKGIDLESYYLGLLGGGGKMWNLIRMEIKKVPLKPHIAGLLIADFIIFLLSVFTSSLLTASGNISTLPGFAPVQLDTVTLAAMLVRATLIVWEAVLISVFVIEEYRNKTIGLLLPLYVGMIKKSTIATVVSSIVIVAIASNSQGSSAGLMSIPDFIPVPSSEIMQTISIVSLIVGICLVGAGLLFLFLNKKKGKERKSTTLWIITGVGVLLIANHGIQLLF